MTGGRQPVVVEAVRTPIGRRGGALAGLKAVELLRHVQVEVVGRAGIDAGEVDQVIGGCVTQIGEQSLNVTRNAWLNSGLDHRVGATTVDASCGSAQQANHLVAALIAAGAIDVGIGCGVESMSRVPIGSNLSNGPGHYKTRDYPYDDPPHAQFGGAERIARREGFSRRDADEYGVRSQRLAAQAWEAAVFKPEVTPIAAPLPHPDGGAGGGRAGEGGRGTDGWGTDGWGTNGRGADGRASDGGAADGRGTDGRGTDGRGTDGGAADGRGGGGGAGGGRVLVDRDEGLRETTVDGLAALPPVLPDGIHTAGTTSQVSDGAAAVLWMAEGRARALGLRPRARLLAQVVTGADPYYLLDGPIVATRKILDRSGTTLADIDRYEVNEAFAAVVLAWSRAYGADQDRLNVNGGAISLGHPLGATGTRLLVSALTELERTDGELALVTMCCGGSQGTASILQRV